MIEPPDDERFMRAALAEAVSADEDDEIPVGAVVVHEGRIIGRGRNQKERLRDPTAHAEMLAITAAAAARGDWRLTGCTMYVTLEPCPMCAGALIHARVERVVFAASDPRTGAAGSVFNLLQSDALNHRAEVTGGVMAEESSSLLREFFQKRRLSGQ